MSIRQKFKHRSSDISWTLAYALYLLASIGLIIASEITVKYGGRFFGDPNAVIPTKHGEEPAADPAAEQTLLRAQREVALARNGVVGSVGIAVGSVTLILILAVFAAHQWLDYCGHKRDATNEYRHRENLTIATTFLNVVLLCGNAALTAGFSLSADAIRLHTEVNQSSAPNYLIGCAVMSALSCSTAGLTIVVDVFKCRRHYKAVESEEQEFGADETVALETESTERK
ncbi:hypothetical protein B0J11DRAFT_580099 [Dendryphion nanum]|uniref:Uncharacterized protein n=1 Tax=Dendryphion nanum TaxID=256645 RepID=A0A9P9DUL4_9PLEO|nr:hypothetical protein B0J11DRAFT_580099 [Dendryphion nanum]